MLHNRHFLLRTFGPKWKIYFPFFLFSSILIALLPSLLFLAKINFNIPRFCEEWLRTVLSLSAVFILANYFNYLINFNRNKDKIHLIVTNFSFIGENVFSKLENGSCDNIEIFNMVNFLEFLIKKIQNEDEFLYKIEGFENFSGHETYFLKLKNHIQSANLTPNQIAGLKAEFMNLKTYLTNIL